MKIDSEYLDIEFDPSLYAMEGKTKAGGKRIEIWDDGDVSLSFGGNEVMLHVDELAEIVWVCKLYRDRRFAYLNKK